MSTDHRKKSVAAADGAAVSFDPGALRKKYEEERAKRISESRGEFQALTDDFASYLDDPYCTPLRREPLRDEIEVVVIGGGLGGLLVGARLREAGVQSIRVIDKAGDFGGVWYWNRYPGVQCDIESYIYLPLLEETDYIPTEKYAHGSEILAHCQRIGKHYNLYTDACFQTEVTELRWDEQTDRWAILTNRGDEMRARFVCLATGNQHRLKLPKIPGIKTFQGHSFHTSRWDYDYTGGDDHGNMSGLRDKVVGIIGTGATAIQCVPHLGRSAAHLYVFQRTPSAVSVRANRPTDLGWAASLEPGWQKRRLENFGELVSGGYESEDLVNDGWTHHIKALLVNPAFKELNPDERVRASQLADFAAMEEIRARVDRIVTDKATADALKPYYNWTCKRPCFHDDYLDTFNLPNVTLVDTDGRGVERITERGVVANGVEFELDCLIHATGFDVSSTAYVQQAGFEVVGRNGVTLTEKWSDGVATLHGVLSSGFPNMLFAPAFLRSQFVTAFNRCHSLQEFATHAAYIIEYCIRNHVTSFDVSEEAEADWVRTIIERSKVSLEFLKDCTPGFFNNEGKPEEWPPQNCSFGGTTREFHEILETWRTDGRLDGLRMQPARRAALD
jgi:cyclohexanone monooxygenase